MAWIKAPENWRSVAQVHDNAPEFEPVHFNENGTANVKQEVADFLVKAYTEIEHYDNNEDDN